MKTMAVGDLKTHFSDVLVSVRKGESVAIGFGRSKRKVAVIVPYQVYKKTHRRKLGVLEGKVSIGFRADFKLTDEEFLAS